METLAVEAIRASQSATAAQAASGGSGASPGRLAPPSASAVSKFEAAMGPDAPAAVPFVSQVSAAWRSAQANNQGMIHRIRAISEMQGRHSLSAHELVELQYDLQQWNLALTTMTNINKNMGDALNSIASNFR